MTNERHVDSDQLMTIVGDDSNSVSAEVMSDGRLRNSGAISEKVIVVDGAVVFTRWEIRQGRASSLKQQYNKTNSGVHTELISE